MMLRIGCGYDVHRLTEQRKLIIGGAVIPYEKGLAGHSDADVLLHAIMDAILGALASGDIGRHFPDNDEHYHGISSRILLQAVYQMMQQQGYAIGNVDSVIVAQRPKLAPYIAEMQNNIASDLQTAASNVNVKATTSEGLGFTGTGQGIAAYATVILRKNIE